MIARPAAGQGRRPGGVLASLLALAAATATVAASAHDVAIWPAQAGKEVRLQFLYGDPGDYQRIERVRFVDLAVFDSRGVKLNFLRDIASGTDDRQLVAGPLRLGDWPAGTYVVASRYDNGFHVHDGENRAIATTREWYPDAIDSAHYQKFSKALFRVGTSGGGFDRVVGHRLELIPRVDPFTVKPGEALPIEVRFDGAPVADQVVEVGDEATAARGEPLRTDGRGIVRVKLDHDGAFRLAADRRAPSKYPALYAFDDYTASLVFIR